VIDEILDAVARRYFNEVVSPNPDPAKGQWTYDEMPKQAQDDFKRTIRFFVVATLQAGAEHVNKAVLEAL
jgi:hypothetical protein